MTIGSMLLGHSVGALPTLDIDLEEDFDHSLCLSYPSTHSTRVSGPLEISVSRDDYRLYNTAMLETYLGL
jgi:hypothetical protein